MKTLFATLALTISLTACHPGRKLSAEEEANRDYREHIKALNACADGKAGAECRGYENNSYFEKISGR